MPNLLIKNVPEPVVEKLRQNAAANNRSLQDELMALVCRAAKESAPTQVESGWMTIEQLRAESEIAYPEPVTTGPLAVDIIRRERDAKSANS